MPATAVAAHASFGLVFIIPFQFIVHSLFHSVFNLIFSIYFDQAVMMTMTIDLDTVTFSCDAIGVILFQNACVLCSIFNSLNVSM